MFLWERNLIWNKNSGKITEDIRKNQENMTVKQMIGEIESREKIHIGL